jgi:GAF domain-containing protein
VTPIASPDSGVIGVLELVNASHASEERIVPFSASVQEMVESMSSLAAVAMASYSRESRLRDQIRALEIQIDEARKAREVSEITETDYFKQLRQRARALRSRSRGD